MREPGRARAREDEKPEVDAGRDVRSTEVARLAPASRQLERRGDDEERQQRDRFGIARARLRGVERPRGPERRRRDLGGGRRVGREMERNDRVVVGRWSAGRADGARGGRPREDAPRASPRSRAGLPAASCEVCVWESASTPRRARD
eukprot:31342-Pelagococcus_subviridis.AAC.42